jgi:hypothetical protein
MKHSLIILISFLLLSSPVIGDNHKGETLYGWGVNPDYKWMGFGDKDTHPKYQGQVKDGKPNGLGILIFPNGTKYVGSWVNGKRDGQGTQTYPNEGTKTYPTGSKYLGEWKDGKMNGQGTYTNSYGDKYVGEYKDGERIGQGTLTWTNGDKYVGSWKNGNRNGQGTTTIYESGNKYVGEYKDNQKWNGTGYDKNGNIQVKFVNGKEIGIEIQKPNKDIYNYSTKDVDSIIKKYFPTKKSKYQGDLENGVPHGKGEFTWSDGSKEIGEYKDGNEWNTRYYDKDGNFTYKYVNGTFYNKEGTIILKSENNRLHQRPKIEKKVVNGEWIKQ